MPDTLSLVASTGTNDLSFTLSEIFQRKIVRRPCNTVAATSFANILFLPESRVAEMLPLLAQEPLTVSQPPHRLGVELVLAPSGTFSKPVSHSPSSKEIFFSVRLSSKCLSSVPEQLPVVQIRFSAWETSASDLVSCIEVPFVLNYESRTFLMACDVENILKGLRAAKLPCWKNLAAAIADEATGAAKRIGFFFHFCGGDKFSLLSEVDVGTLAATIPTLLY